MLSQNRILQLIISQMWIKQANAKITKVANANQAWHLTQLLHKAINKKTHSRAINYIFKINCWSHLKTLYVNVQHKSHLFILMKLFIWYNMIACISIKIYYFPFYSEPNFDHAHVKHVSSMRTSMQHIYIAHAHAYETIKCEISFRLIYFCFFLITIKIK